MAIERTASCTWEGPLTGGSGRLTGISSGAFDGLPFTLPTRIAPAADLTSPEELLAAAHAGCYAMAVAAILTDADVPPGRLDVRCTVAVDQIDGALRVTRSTLEVAADVDGVSRDALRAAMDAADASCPYSALVRDAGGDVASAIAD